MGLRNHETLPPSETGRFHIDKKKTWIEQDELSTSKV
jgi:hypothetical protein